MKITIKYISELAGVSRGTVDRVLNNRPGVKPEIREKVLKIVETIEYKPNMAAKALAYSGKPMLIGVLIPSKEDLFFNDVRKGIEIANNEYKDFGIKIEFKSVSNRKQDEVCNAIDEFVKKDVAGLAVSAMDTDLVRNKLKEITGKGMPLVTFNSDIPESGRICFVGQDVYKSGKVAAALMCKVVEHGSEIIAVTGNMKFNAHKARIDGFLDRLNDDAGRIRVVEVIEAFESYEETLKMLLEALTANPDVRGIFMATGNIKGCMDAVKIAGKSGEIHIICNDTMPEIIEAVRDRTIDFTITQDPFAQGYKSVKLLYDFIVGGVKPKETTIFTDIGIKVYENL